MTSTLHTTFRNQASFPPELKANKTSSSYLESSNRPQKRSCLDSDGLGIKIFYNHMEEKPFTDEMLEKKIEKAAKIIEVSITTVFNELTDRGIVALSAKASCLVKLELHGLEDRISPVVFRALMQKCQSLRTLVVKGCNNLESGFFLTLTQSCPDLENISLHNCKTVKDTDIASIAEKCLKLKMLHLQDYERTHLKDQKLSPLAKARQLEDLELSNVTDDEINILFPSNDSGANHNTQLLGSNLVSLNLATCQDLTDDSIKPIVGRCRKLETLDIAVCTGLTEKSLQFFKENPLESLTTLYFPHTIKMTDQAIEYLKVGCPNLRTLYGFIYSDLIVEHLGNALGETLTTLSLWSNNDDDNHLANWTLEVLPDLFPNLERLVLHTIGSSKEGLYNKEAILVILNEASKLKKLALRGFDFAGLIDQEVQSVADNKKIELIYDKHLA